MGAVRQSRPWPFQLFHSAVFLASIVICCAATCEATAAERAADVPRPQVPLTAAQPGDDEMPIPWSTLFQGAIMALLAWTYKSVRDHELLLARLDERLRSADATDKRLRAEIDRLLSLRQADADEEAAPR